MIMNKKFFFSIIVPVYRTELYLRDCILSVIEQNHTNFELILVDNGSSKECKDICNDFAHDERVIIECLNENQGIAAARNRGIEVSRGEYLLFLDSDDFYVNNDVLNNLNSLLNKEPDADVVLLQTLLFKDSEQKFTGTLLEFDANIINNSSLTESVEYLVKNNKYVSCAWNKVVRKEFVIVNDLLFVNGIRGEDVEWFFRVMCSCKSFKSVGEPCYGNRLRENSTQADGYTKKIWLDIYGFLSSNRSIIKNSNYYTSLLLDDLAKFYYIILAQSNGFLERDNLLLMASGISEYQKVSYSLKNKVCRFLVNILGARLASKIMFKYTSRKKL